MQVKYVAGLQYTLSHQVGSRYNGAAVIHSRLEFSFILAVLCQRLNLDLSHARTYSIMKRWFLLCKVQHLSL